MEPLYRESRPLLPRNLTYLVAVVLVATLAFMAYSQYAMGTEMASWMLPLSVVIFAIVIIILLVLRLDFEVYDDRVEITYLFRKTTIQGREVMDVRKGDLTEIKSYGGWNLKGVKHRTYSRIGDDEGVAMKLLGKRVVVVSTSDSERVFPLIPREEAPEDPGSSGEVVEEGKEAE